ncbi:hypothetical protein GS831_14055 [Rhodococcus hoagii]|nr:hypothetical protein [Prescottella equi]
MAQALRAAGPRLAGALDTDGLAGTQRTALGVLRLVLASAPPARTGAGTDAWTSRTRACSWCDASRRATWAMIATSPRFRPCPPRWRVPQKIWSRTRKRRARALAVPTETDRPLRAAAAAALDVAPDQVEIPGTCCCGSPRRRPGR